MKVKKAPSEWRGSWCVHVTQEGASHAETCEGHEGEAEQHDGLDVLLFQEPWVEHVIEGVR